MKLEIMGITCRTWIARALSWTINRQCSCRMHQFVRASQRENRDRERRNEGERYNGKKKKFERETAREIKSDRASEKGNARKW